MSLAPDLVNLRAAIKQTMEGVEGIGVVNDYERYAKRASDLVPAYIAGEGDAAQLRGWYIRRVATNERSISANVGGRFVLEHTWRIRGFMALQDKTESEKEFDLLIERMRQAFIDNTSLGFESPYSVTTDTPGQCALALEESEPVLFADVLCHSAKLSLITKIYQ